MLWVGRIGKQHSIPGYSDHFISGGKSNDSLCPDYAPSLFAHISTPLKNIWNNLKEVQL